jgi:hypothetical protein
VTDRHCGYTVVLDREVREDDSEHIINAIKMIRGVLDVTPVVSDVEHHIARRHTLQEMRKKLWDALEDDR